MQHDSMALDRRKFLSASALAIGALGLSGGAFSSPAGKARRIPVAFVTDIGDDIDDTWALGLLLKSPELDLKLAVTDYGKPEYRGKLLAKFLETAGHGHIPVGLGPEYGEQDEGGQLAWVKDYDLDGYQGAVHRNGTKALVDCIMSSPEPITLISVGPMPTVAEALTMEPRIAQRARFVGMYGSVRAGYNDAATPVAEWNIRKAIKPAQLGLAAPWDITITPLDTCGLVSLEGERYQRLLKSRDSIVAAIIENYRLWLPTLDKKLNIPGDFAETGSTTLFDTVAVYLAMSQDFCNMERLNIRVTDGGFTSIAGQGKAMNVATAWRDIEGYKDWLVNRLLAHE